MRTLKPISLLAFAVTDLYFDRAFMSAAAFQAVPLGRMPVAFLHRNTLSCQHDTTSSTSRLLVSQLRDADFIERMVGGERYEMIPLPDSMVPTTVFVGNLCEFVNDDILSDLFQAVSTLKSVPACVARKPNASSLRYGFVTFPTVEEKEAAIIRFHGTELNGRCIKVEEIRDDPSFKRVRVPERMVLYACGEAKKTRDGRTNTMRRISRYEDQGKRSRASKKHRSSKKNSIRLNGKEQQAMDRAIRRGYVELSGTGYRRGRKGSALSTMHRQWCDEREKPHIILCKATGGRPLDNVIVDLSPLRMSGLFHDNHKLMDGFLIQWKTEILIAADRAGMELRDDYVEDNSILLEKKEDAEDDQEPMNEFVFTFDSNAWTSKPIFQLPAVSMGVFEGDRSKAKQMVKELAELWDIPEQTAENYRDNKHSRRDGGTSKYKNKAKAMSRQRRSRRRELEFW